MLGTIAVVEIPQAKAQKGSDVSGTAKTQGPAAQKAGKAGIIGPETYTLYNGHGKDVSAGAKIIGPG
jgi:hypothetical protein